MIAKLKLIYELLTQKDPSQLICGCCGCTEIECDLRRPLSGWVEHYHLDKIMCSDCFTAWHHGVGGRDEVKKYVLENRAPTEKDRG